MKIYGLIFLTLSFAFSAFAQTRGAEVVVPKTFVRKSPASNAQTVYTLENGAKIAVDASQNKNGWYYVAADGKYKGWINANTIRLTADAPTAETVVQTAQTSVQPVVRNSQNTASTNKTDQPTAKTDAPAEKADTAEPVEKQTPPARTPTNSTAATPTAAATPAAATPTAAAATPTAASSPEAAAIPAEDEEVLRIDTEEVNLNVRVVDAANRPVKNLNQSQFQVYEDEVLQPITFLTTADVPTNYALLLDNSRSLRTQLQKIAEAGKIIVGTNRANDKSTVVRFVTADKIQTIQRFTGDKKLLGEALDNLFVEGGQTAVVDAIYATAKTVEEYEKSLKKDDVRRRALVLVSDGDDRGSTRTEQQLFELLRASDVQIYAVGFVNELTTESKLDGVDRREKAKSFLTRLATETGGKVYFPNSIDELAPIAADISADLRTQYLITYAPTGEKRTGDYRNIKVSVADSASGEKRIAVTRTSRAATETKTAKPR